MAPVYFNLSFGYQLVRYPFRYQFEPNINR